MLRPEKLSALFAVGEPQPRSREITAFAFAEARFPERSPIGRGCMAFDHHNLGHASCCVEFFFPLAGKTVPLVGICHPELQPGRDLRAHNLPRHLDGVRRALRSNDHRIDVAHPRHRVRVGFERALDHGDDASRSARQQHVDFH